MVGSLSFDPAAEYYDRTRVTDAVSLSAAIDLLHDVLPPGPALEIGVGTGALAVPVAARGRRLVGVDLSRAMLAKLHEKDPGGLGRHCHGRRHPIAVRLGVVRRGLLPMGLASDRGLA